MSEEYMRTSDIGALLGHTNLGSTRKWISKLHLEADARDVDTGEKIYLRSKVEEAIRRQPGQGARTDLRGRPTAEGPPTHDHDGVPGSGD